MVSLLNRSLTLIGCRLLMDPHCRQRPGPGYLAFRRRLVDQRLECELAASVEKDHFFVARVRCLRRAECDTHHRSRATRRTTHPGTHCPLITWGLIEPSARPTTIGRWGGPDQAIELAISEYRNPSSDSDYPVDDGRSALSAIARVGRAVFGQHHQLTGANILFR